MDEKKFVTLEMFEEYNKKLMEYIGMHDDLILNGKTAYCPICDKEMLVSSSDTITNCPTCGHHLSLKEIEDE